ncbi:ABC transporter permease subunit [Kineosporia mesophila]|uniref:ABC transporter permease subunit n=1 Tax=Kineosporia mesophila TaxID=566012 RepID=A0ABP6ZAY1_9ACTN
MSGLRRWVFALPVGAVVTVAVIGPWLAPGSITAPVGRPFEPGGTAHLLGTDVLGRDVLARVLAGGRALVLQAIAATLLGSLAGLSVGIGTARTCHRRTAAAGQRAVDAFAAVPAVLVLLLAASGSAGSDVVVAVAITAVSIPFSVRIIHERTSRLITTDYVCDARARGESGWAVIRYDLLPGIAPVALAEGGIRFVAATQLAATAGFLGLGAGAPTANWGRMVRENSTGLNANPLPVIVPAVLLVVLAVGMSALLDRLAVERAGGLEQTGQLA